MDSVELQDGHRWVEVTSHRSRQRMESALGGVERRSFGVWPEKGGWATGEYYQVPEVDLDKVSSIPGVKVRKIAPRGKIFWRMK